MRCISCGFTVKAEKWVVTIRGEKKVYCNHCFAVEWGDYVHNIVNVEGSVKKDPTQMKISYYELDIKFKKYFVGD